MSFLYSNVDNIDDCATSPCVHGVCVDGINQYTCTCDTGWEGGDCSTNINDCNPNPCVHGTCSDQIAGYSCACQNGYEGRYSTT